MASGDFTKTEDNVVGELSMITGTMELQGGAISAGGIAPIPAKFGLASVSQVFCEIVELAATTALLARYDAATDKVMFYDGGGAGVAFPESNEDTTASIDMKITALGRK